MEKFRTRQSDECHAARQERTLVSRVFAGGQNANRCASFVSVDTCFHGLFWPKIAEMAETNDPVKT
jgi:hypothetical protein